MTGFPKTANLVVIPTPGMGHLVPAMELARLLVARDTRLTVTVLFIKLPVTDDKLDSYILSLKSNPSLLNNGVALIEMPVLDPTSYKPGYLTLYMESYKSKVKEAVEGLRAVGPVGGIILDMFCSAMFDDAADLGIPSYLFFTSGATLVSLIFHLRGLGVDVSEEYDVVRSPDTALEFPGFRNPVPVSVWPGTFLEKHDGSGGSLRQVDKYRRAKGILVNTFTELERELIHSISQDDRIPPVIPVGPILSLTASDDELVSSSKDPIMRWLDDQPPRSVVFLCFGSRGSFNNTQVKEIADGIEHSGRRFLWSLRIKPENRSGSRFPLELDDPGNVLPGGFLDRTAERGRVIGWAPQARVLAHVAVGAFVSHCGWNSILESLWYGVPIATWPIDAEQQMNAFMLVRELGIATEIRVEYRRDFGINMVVEAAEVEDGIRKATESAELVKKKVTEMSEAARKAVREGGSSYVSVGEFIKEVFESIDVLIIKLLLKIN